MDEKSKRKERRRSFHGEEKVKRKKKERGSNRMKNKVKRKKRKRFQFDTVEQKRTKKELY